MTNQRAPEPKQLGLYVTLAQVGLEMVAPVVVGLVLDFKLGWMPWSTVVGAVFGLVIGLWHMVMVLHPPKGPGSSQQPRNEP
jgi:hypothetical protein